MGLSGGSTTQKQQQTVTPVYDPQLQGAAGQATQQYNVQTPKLTNITDMIGGLAPQFASTLQNGDSNVNAARAYNSDVLSGKYLGSNPYLEGIIANSNDDTRNGLAASLGTRGLTGGSDFANIISGALAKNDTNLRYTDYGNQLSRMDQAASAAPSLAAAQYLPLSALEDTANAQLLPQQAANSLSGTIGGLLGQYTNSNGTVKTTQNPSLLSSLGQVFNIGSAIAGLFPGGGAGVHQG